MPHDMNGNILKVGDRISVECEITAVQMGDEYCNLTVSTVQPMYPSENKTTITLNTKQVALIPTPVPA